MQRSPVHALPRPGRGPIALALAATAALLLLAASTARADITDPGDFKAGNGIVAGSTTANPGTGEILANDGLASGSTTAVPNPGELELVFAGTKSVQAFTNGLALEAVDDMFIDMFIHKNHNVGIGTFNPEQPLHVRRTNGSARLLVEEGSGTTANRTLLDLQNNGGAFARFVDTSPSPDDRWVFGNSANGDFLINANAGAPVDARLTQAGNLTIPGTLSQGSDRRLKEAIRKVEPNEVLRKLAQLPIRSWRYKADRKRARHIGPMARRFREAFGLGHSDKFLAPGDLGGVALAAIKAQQAQLNELKSELGALRGLNRRLEERIAALEG